MSEARQLARAHDAVSVLELWNRAHFGPMNETPQAGPYLIQVPIIPAISGVVNTLTASRLGTSIWDGYVNKVNGEKRLFDGFRVVMPHTNFTDPKTGLDKIGGAYRARNFVKSGAFCFWVALVPVKG